MKRVVPALAATAVAAALMAIPAFAHQTVTSNGARVSMHVTPDDAPEAGVTTDITVVKVKVPSGGRFSFRTCGCRLKITNSSGTVLRNSAMRSKTTFRFPSAGAYRLTYSGSYRRSGNRKRFSASFAIRAS